MRKLFDQLSGSFYNELMEAWSPNPGYPIRIRICADARITPTNILDDQVWDLSFLAGEQSTLSLETSFSLRARLMRLYFLYKDVGKPTLGPEKRFSNTQFLEILPNYIKTLSRPFTDIEVTSEYFAQASDAIAGRITLNNTGSTTKYIQTDAFCKLIPFGQGKQAGVQQQGLNKVFAGHC
ncbi:MAG: hypothetical protein HGA86_08325, partial [Anaerolineaceae bacterium]|nr:hypothetical protein [Anaerolineaceae bacterium]